MSAITGPDTALGLAALDDAAYVAAKRLSTSEALRRIESPGIDASQFADRLAAYYASSEKFREALSVLDYIDTREGPRPLEDRCDRNVNRSAILEKLGKDGEALTLLVRLSGKIPPASGTGCATRVADLFCSLALSSATRAVRFLTAVDVETRCRAALRSPTQKTDVFLAAAVIGWPAVSYATVEWLTEAELASFAVGGDPIATEIEIRALANYAVTNDCHSDADRLFSRLVTSLTPQTTEQRKDVAWLRLRIEACADANRR